MKINGKRSAQEDLRHNSTKSEDSKSDRGKPKVCSTCCAKWKEATRCFQTKNNLLLTDASRLQRIKHGFLCPPHGLLASWLTKFFAVLLFWGVCWAITGNEALPGGNIFALVVLVVLCEIGGCLVEKIRLPPLLGMLIMGCLLRNVPRVNIGKDINPRWSSTLRSIALVVILTRAGLGLDPVALRKLSCGVLRLAFLPCLVEAVTAATASHLLLGFPWPWGFMLGFILAAVSPAVVVPSMINLDLRGYGVDKGIPTLVTAAASLDDVLAISGFGVAMGIAFSQGSLAWTIVKGPLEVLVGIVYGLVVGMVFWYFPQRDHERKTLYRYLLLLGGGLLAVLGSRAAHVAGAGALGCLTLAFVAALRWRKDVTPGHQPMINVIFAEMWKLFQPLLFGLIGAEVDIMKIRPSTVGFGVAVLCIGLSIRMVMSFVVVFKLGLNYKEMLFVPLAWLPKATVQAALGSVPLDTAREKNLGQRQIDMGSQILTIAVLVILITAPLGSAAIALAAPRLLKMTPRVLGEEETPGGQGKQQMQAESSGACAESPGPCAERTQETDITKL